MNRFGLLNIFFVALLILALGLNEPGVAWSEHSQTDLTGQNVTITDEGNYFKVELLIHGGNSENGVSRRQIGSEYGAGILKAVPGYEALIDSYLADCSGNDRVYNILMKRVADIRPRIEPDYLDEILGMASQFSGTQNIRDDGRLSEDEVLLFNLLPDVNRLTQCAALAVFGKRSETRRTIAARLLDWYDGSAGQIAKIQAITVIRQGNRSVCLIGYLGFQGMLTGFNTRGIFGGILDSPTGKPFSTVGKRSYSMDFRHAMENCDTLQDVAGYMADDSRGYTFNHLIFLGDPLHSQVLENNWSGDGNRMRRGLRSWNSPLNPGISWKIPEAVGAVNSFVLKGNADNHTSRYNTNASRWDAMKSALLAQGKEVTFQELRQVISFHHSGSGKPKEGSLYNPLTQQIIMFIPGTLEMEVFFKPRNGPMPDEPVFEKVAIDFK